ncbi:MAG: VWA domain-containing protein [Pegethrix bostrychoides GSE-TBD4-15B]|jgi:Ca-activated chloride channel family protein|uniref:VWA domain-containing protein n=1 Tax=Pegethrix bostrychoides GSE-TBD4-15B TaxID=2839662 RepID=A0A951P8N5_9CYAN|nr:VWA domain-containing protein [Pegethrix bostrychoides GSE-TBD4-15B]
MNKHKYRLARLASVLAAASLTACTGGSSTSSGFEVKFLVGSALGDFCNQAAEKFNAQQPKVSSEAFRMVCEAEGSGDVVTKLTSLAEQLKAGTLSADAPEFPTLVSVDGEIYQSLLIDRINQIYPGQPYIAAITDSPLLASSPVVFMAPADLAPGLSQQPDLFKQFVTAKTHRDLDAASPPWDIHYVQTAPSRSNSGLQTLVAQYASVSGKRPEQMTLADVQQYTPQVKAIQQKVTRYGVSTNSLANAMVKNGAFWASVGSVYESSVIQANASLQPGQPRYQAIYPQSTFSANMRAILPTAPWVSDREKAAAEQVIAFLQSPDAQQIATDLGLRPGTPGVALGAKFSPEFGVAPQAKYDSYRPPQPQVAEAMIEAWQQIAKKPSLVVLVVDSSGSMKGNKLPAVQSTLQTYISKMSPQDQVALIDFDSEIREPILIDGSAAGRERGMLFISSLRAEGGTALYDSALYARNWLQKNLRPGAINAVLVLTDGEDSGSQGTLDQLKSELTQSGFESDQRISFFTVGYGNESEFDSSALEQIAQPTGGYYAKGDPESIARVMDNLQLEF